MKMCVKTKEFGPVGGGGMRQKILCVDPPMLTERVFEPFAPLPPNHMCTNTDMQTVLVSKLYSVEFSTTLQTLVKSGSR